MTGTPTVLVENHSPTDASSYATASVSPTAGHKVLVGVLSGRTDGTAGAVTGVTGAPVSGTATEVLHIASASGNLHLSIWEFTASGSAGALTINFGGTQLNCHWKVISVASAAVSSTNKGSSQGVSTATLTLPSAPATSSEVIAFYGVNSGSQTPTVGSGFTVLGTETVDSTPSNALSAEHRTGSTSQTVNFTPAGTAQNILGAVELTNTGSPPPTASHETTITRVIDNSGGVTQDVSIDYAASSNTTSVAIDDVAGGGLVVGDITVTGLVLSFTDDPARTDAIVIDVTLTGAGGTTANTVTIPPIGAPDGIRTRVWVAGSPDHWA